MSNEQAPETASALYQQGADMMQEVYRGNAPVLPEGSLPFNDVMMRTLFAQVWSRTDVLSIRDRRLLLLGAISAQGANDAWKVQARSALDREELTADELQETLIMLAPYAGYPRISALLGAWFEVVGAFNSAQQDASSDD